MEVIRRNKVHSLRLKTSDLLHTAHFFVFFVSGTRSACINAATLALADAGIPMRDLVTSCSAGYLNTTPLLGKGKFVLTSFVTFSMTSVNKLFKSTDLNYVEDSAGGPDVTVGLLPKLDKVTLLQVKLFSSYL